MSFRRDKEHARAWQAWLQHSRDQLLACGVPLAVLEHEGHWIYFLEHGYYTPPGIVEPVICIDRMEKAQAERLCCFLEEDDYYPDNSTLNALQYLLKRGRHGEAHV